MNGFKQFLTEQNEITTIKSIKNYFRKNYRDLLLDDLDKVYTKIKEHISKKLMKIRVHNISKLITENGNLKMDKLLGKTKQRLLQDVYEMYFLINIKESQNNVKFLRLINQAYGNEISVQELQETKTAEEISIEIYDLIKRQIYTLKF